MIADVTRSLTALSVECSPNDRMKLTLPDSYTEVAPLSLPKAYGTIPDLDGSLLQQPSLVHDASQKEFR